MSKKSIEELEEDLEETEEQSEDDLDEESTEETQEETKPASKKEEHQSPGFEEAIKKYLDGFAQTDSNFAGKYADPSKSIAKCCNYIVNEVHKMKVKGLTDGEVYHLARHYYEEDIKESDTKHRSCTIVTNKPGNEKKADKPITKKEEQPSDQFTGGLFDLL